MEFPSAYNNQRDLRSYIIQYNSPSTNEVPQRNNTPPKIRQQSFTCAKTQLCKTDLRERPQNVYPVGWIGQPDVDDLVEPAGPEDGRIDDVGPVARGHEEHLPPALDAVHLRQHLIDDPRRRRAVALRALWAQGVDLVEEDDAGRRVAGPNEALAHRLLALADVLRADKSNL